MESYKASVVFVIMVYLKQQLSHALSVGPEEYCSLDIFEPKCDPDEVVIMSSALYGRMAIGKCIQQGAEKIGCNANVLNVMDSLCSGRTSCSVPTIHRSLFATKPCRDMLSYLSVSYSCQKVAQTTRQCQSVQETLTATASPTFISPLFTSCPTTITTPTGQLLNFTVYNFLPPETSACYEIGVIIEEGNRKALHICGNYPRAKEMHLTSTNKATIEITERNDVNFVIQFQATGCPQPPIPHNAHLEREGSRAKVKCNVSDNSWFIYCKNNEWSEHDRKCPNKDWGINKIFKSDTDFPYGIFLTSFIGVGIGIFLGGFLLFVAINAFQRHQRRLRQAYGAPPVIPDPDYKIYDTSKMDFTLVPGFGTGGHHTIPRHQMSPPPVPLQPPEDDRRFSRHTYEKPKYNSTDNSPFVEA